MSATGGFPIDLVLFGLIALFLVLRLRSILGGRVGFERPRAQQPAPVEAPVPPTIDGKAEPVPTAPLPEPGTPIGQAFAAMRGIDPRFDPGAFLGGADKAFRLIVGAFAAGDRTTLRGLLGDDMFHAFDSAIGTRESLGHTQISEIRRIENMAFANAALHGSVASLEVRIVSDQISATRDSAGKTIAGTDSVTEIVDIWTFERDLRSPNPTWRLVAARSA